MLGKCISDCVGQNAARLLREREVSPRLCFKLELGLDLVVGLTPKPRRG